MPTRSEDFAGLSVAMITPFRDGQVDIEALQRQVEFQIAGRHDLRLPGGHDRRMPHALAPRARAGDRGRGRGGRRPDQGHGRHRLEQHRRGPAADPLGRQGRGRRRAGRRPLLQQADAGRLLSALQGPGRGGRHSDLRLQHPRPDRQEHRAGDDRPHGRVAEHHDGQGGHRLDGPGLADHRRDRPDRPSAATTA